MQPVPYRLNPPLSQWATDITNQVRQLTQPDAPNAVYACTQTNLPKASTYQNCILYATNLNTLAVSNGTNWLRVDTGASIG